MVGQPEGVEAVTLHSNHPLLATFVSTGSTKLVFHSHSGFLVHSAASHKVRIVLLAPSLLLCVKFFLNLCSSMFWDISLVIGWLSQMTPHPWCLWCTQCMACYVMEGQLSYLTASYDHPAQVPIEFYLYIAIHATVPL